MKYILGVDTSFVPNFSIPIPSLMFFESISSCSFVFFSIAKDDGRWNFLLNFEIFWKAFLVFPCLFQCLYGCVFTLWYCFWSLELCEFLCYVSPYNLCVDYFCLFPPELMLPSLLSTFSLAVCFYIYPYHLIWFNSIVPLASYHNFKSIPDALLENGWLLKIILWTLEHYRKITVFKNIDRRIQKKHGE